MKKLFFTSIILCSFLFLLSKDAKASEFVAHFFYESSSKVLYFDKSVSEKVSLDNEKSMSIFDFSDESNSGNYVAKLYENNGEELASGFFNAKQGSFVVEVSYISIASSLKIYEKTTNKEVLSADISQFVTCNKNGICEFEKGENFNTCISDCASSNVKYSPETQKILDENGGVIKDPKTGGVVLKGGYSLDNSVTAEEQPVKKGIGFGSILLIISIGVAIGITTFLVLRRMRESD